MDTDAMSEFARRRNVLAESSAADATYFDRKS
jgi:hypothetical protein